MKQKKLSTYNEKRRFDATPEPSGAEARSPHARENGGLFVIQKHRATRLHYDVRLELDGVLVSWAVPKGPSLDPKDRRLAVHVEDHPLDYKDFEGVIPKGNYGAGEVIVWDQGTWEWTPTPGKTKAKSAADAIRKGKLDFTVASDKLRGRFVIVRSGGDEKAWMLIKVRDEHARPGSDIEAERPESVLTGRRVEELKEDAPGEHRWSSHEGLVTPKQRALPDLKRLLGRSASHIRDRDIPKTARPMVPTLVDALPAGHDDASKWLAEIKLDGVRALAFKKGGDVRLVAPNGDDVTRTFPEVARAVARLPGDAVLDVELCVLDDKGRSRSQLIQPRLEVANEKAIERLARETPAVAFAFDLLQLGEADLRAVPLEKRKAVLEALLPADDERLRYLSHVAGQSHDFYEVACENDLEGIVLKRTGSKYASGRSRQWLMLECEKANEASEPPGKPRPKLTNREKVFFPGEGITKGDLFDYYEEVAETLLAHTRDRPMVLRRLPDGIEGPSFYQKNAKSETPDWVRTVRLWSKDTRRWIHYMVVDDVATLLYVVQLGCISLSPWSSRVGSLDEADFSILDLDPGDECDFEQVIELALLSKEILDELGLRGYCKTSGATGLHVQVPLAAGHSYEDARTLAELVARTAEARRPDLVTTVRTVKKRRKDRIYFDYLQNIPGKTVACVYSVREKPHAPVSTPLRWEEVKSGLRPEHFTIANVPARIAKVGDLWRPMLDDRQELPRGRRVA